MLTDSQLLVCFQNYSPNKTPIFKEKIVPKNAFLAQKDKCLCDKTENKRFIHVNPRTYMQIHTPTVVQGGWMEAPPPQSF